MTVTLRDVLLDAAGPEPTVPAEAVIAGRAARVRRHALLLKGGAVAVAVSVVAAVALWPGVDDATVRTVGPAHQRDGARGADDAEDDGGDSGGQTSHQTTTSSGSTRKGTASTLVPATPLVPAPGAIAPPQGTPDHSAAVPGSQARIAFRRNDGVYTMTLDGRAEQRVLDDAAVALLAWSPDRRQLLLLGAATPNHTLDVLQLDTGERRVLVSYVDAGVGSADWSPDGERVVYSLTKPSAQGTRDFTQVWTAKLDGTEQRRLPVSAVSVSWAPNGRIVADGGCEGAPAGQPCSVNPDGSDPRGIPVSSTAAPRWSPDGRWIAYIDAKAEGMPLMVARPDGTGARRVGLGHTTQASWAPDNRLVYSITDSAQGADETMYGVYIVGADGGGNRRLTSGRNDAFPITPSR